MITPLYNNKHVENKCKSTIYKREIYREMMMMVNKVLFRAYNNSKSTWELIERVLRLGRWFMGGFGHRREPPFSGGSYGVCGRRAVYRERGVSFYTQ
jgi:hypothetical protein